jgi:hypothetical protein
VYKKNSTPTRSRDITTTKPTFELTLNSPTTKMSSDASLKKDMIAETPESLSPPLSATASNELTPEEAARAFKPTVAFYLAMTTLALLTFIVALDATALAVALPVSP